jgi:hypothetical protein
MRNCNRENMQQLVDALESDEFEQTNSTLRRDDKFCCLGVACQISGVGVWASSQGYSGVYFYVTLSGATGQVLPVDVMNWLGVGTDDAEDNFLASQLILDAEAEGDTETGSNMNDNGYSFYEIAARIRQTYGLGDSDGTDS